MKGRLRRLRDTLKKQARQLTAGQLVGFSPPWRRRTERTIEPPSVQTREAARFTGQVRPATNRREIDPGHEVVRDKPSVQRRKQAAPIPKKPAFEYWEFPNDAAVREQPPESISDADRARFAKLLQAGVASPPSGGKDLFIILGLDLGTSSTKLIVRLPYEAGQPTIAIPAPAPCRSGGNPYLWQTVLWLREDGAFRPWPEAGATILNRLKQGLIQGRSETRISDSGAAAMATRAQAGVAYLAFVIRYAKGWLLRNRPGLFRRRQPNWSVNLGMPTASHDDPKLVGPYRRIGAAALRLAEIDTPVTVEVTQRCLGDPHVVSAGASEGEARKLGVAVVPEAAAEMTGFAKSTRNAPGLYLLVDVGAMTLDACMFRLHPDVSASDFYAFMAAQVRPLGVDSFHWFLGGGKTETEFVTQCGHMLREIVWATKRHRDPHAESWRPGYDVPVFLAGGGAPNRLHRDVVGSLDPWLKEHARNDGIRLLELPVPNGIELPDALQDFGRMAVAWGLSYPPMEIGEIWPVSDIEDVPPAAVSDFSGNFVSKDDV